MWPDRESRGHKASCARNQPSVYEEQDGADARAQPMNYSGAFASYLKQSIDGAREARPSRARFIKMRRGAGARGKLGDLCEPAQRIIRGWFFTQAAVV
jgi:hypothetical protein